jgi:hypothetical protein
LNASFIDCRFGGRGRLFDLDERLDRGSIYFSRPIDITRGGGRHALTFPMMSIPA